MTREQYKKYDKILEELRPVKWFLNWCGDRYKDKSVSKYRFRIITKAKQFFLYKDIYFARDKEVEIPTDGSSSCQRNYISFALKNCMSYLFLTQKNRSLHLMGCIHCCFQSMRQYERTFLVICFDRF